MLQKCYRRAERRPGPGCGQDRGGGADGGGGGDRRGSESYGGRPRATASRGPPTSRVPGAHTVRTVRAVNERLRQQGELCKRDFTHLTATAGHAAGHRGQNQLRLNLLSRLVPLVRHCPSAQDSESATSSAASSDRLAQQHRPRLLRVDHI